MIQGIKPLGGYIMLVNFSLFALGWMSVACVAALALA